MEFEPEFPIPTYREREAISHYLEIESEFMASKEFYSNRRNLKIRQLAVSIIARHSQGVDPDAFVPYLAMNYFDRFVSRNPDSEVEVRLVAICCLTIAAKMRTKSFSVNQFLRDKFVDYDHETIMKTELLILNGLEWRMRSVTAFCFLDHYYPTFKRIGGFKRRCINEIIVQSQGENFFIQYTPSDIALSSFLAATHIAYPLKFPKIDHPEVLTPCLFELVALCLKENIEIERAELEMASASSATVAIHQGQSEEVAAAETKTQTETDTDQQRPGKAVVETSEEIVAAETESDKQRQAKGKAVVVAEIEEEEEEEAAAKVGVSISEIVPAAEAAPKKLMNFDLRWPTYDPFSISEPIDESRIASIRPPVTIRPIELRDREVPEDTHCFELPSCRCNIG